MLALQEISDRLEIQQLFTDYAEAIDQKKFEALDAIFTPDAYIDYRALGGIDGRYPEIKAWLATTLEKFPGYYHLNSNVSFRITGDSARTRTMCFNPMQVALPDGKVHTMFFGLWYLDQLVRTPQGWRIAERVEEKCFDYNVPGSFQVPGDKA